MARPCEHTKLKRPSRFVISSNLCLPFFKNLFIYFWLHWVFVAACGLFSSCGERGLFFLAVRRLLIAVASLVEHGL